jgi:tetratricopeptide (TPR) repeat protein
MKRVLSSVFVLACLCAAPLVYAQASGSQQNKQKPAADAPRPTASQNQSPASSNEFPEDTSSVPVMPDRETLSAPPPSAVPSSASHIPLPDENDDPVRSPEGIPATASGGNGSYSSSSAGMSDVFEPPPDTDKRYKSTVMEPVHHESAKEDISVGSYYLQTKNWRGALSRFQSALVLAPENPEVYWGLAECQRHLGQYAAAKANYLKVMAYDPDSKHSKDARKILKQPEMENAPAVSASEAAPRQ